MDARDLFLLADAALRSVIDRIDPADFGRGAPQAWTRTPNPTIRDIIAAHAHDEAWVPDLLAGRTIEQVGDRWRGDLLGDDPIARYDAISDAATAAMTDPSLDQSMTLHFSYGDYPFSEGVPHLCSYRAFQSWQIARELGIEYAMPPELVAGLDELLLPLVPQLREYGVFPPAVEPPAGADAQTRLLGAVGIRAD